MNNNNDTIVAVATGRGGAIAVVRVSGPDATAVCDSVFRGRTRLSDAAGYTVHFGEVRDGERLLDQVLATVFRAPHSYTGEDSVEISCHASTYIESRLVQLLIEAGARTATAGEFTVRAFLAGKLDLAQAEAVADLIASGGRAQHSLAMGQLKGGVSSALAALRERLVGLAALLELELDFGEEDVEFASRDALRALVAEVVGELDALAATFSLGNAIRRGVPVAIAGAPNAGKSTLLNALVGEERAMTSEIAGTTRDRIEARVNIGGVEFRLIDTAGLRETDDVLERMGIDRAREAVARAWAVLLVVDSSSASRADVAAQVSGLDMRPDRRLCVVLNKADKAATLLTVSGISTFSAVPSAAAPSGGLNALSDGSGGGISTDVAGVAGETDKAEDGGLEGIGAISLSAKTGAGMDDLRAWLLATVDTAALEAGGAVVSAARHHEALTRAREAVERVRVSLEAGLSADLLSEDVRETLHHLGTITGAVTSDDILGTIFSKFCIGK